MIPDELFMTRALEVAQLGAGSVSPNPLVGCVVVYDGKIIGEGWHQRYGAAHAEVNAISSVKDSALLSESTVYVNLEPCAHFGKTPPCADLLVRSKVKRVVIANRDVNPLVAGKGILKLQDAGIDVTVGVLETQGRDLNRRFFTMLDKQRPYIILKWAQTADGFIARENYESKWISNEQSRKLVHRWRAEEDAILVGTKTAAHDNPQLNVRDWTGRNPSRLVIDRFLRLDKKLHLFDQRQKTICFNVLRHEEHDNLTLARLDEENFFKQMLVYLQQARIQSIIVEGGAFTLNTFLAEGLWDEIRVFESARTFGAGIRAPQVAGHLHQHFFVDGDDVKVFRNGR